MKVHEYQAKGLFADYGVPVDKSILCKTPEEAVTAYKKLGVQRCVVKAQVHTGGRRNQRNRGQAVCKCHLGDEYQGLRR